MGTPRPAPSPFPLISFSAFGNLPLFLWADRLRVLLGKNLIKNISNEITMGYIATLADIEVKLKLLNVRSDNVQIPNDPPDVPPPPSSFDF